MNFGAVEFRGFALFPTQVRQAWTMASPEPFFWRELTHPPRFFYAPAVRGPGGTSADVIVPVWQVNAVVFSLLPLYLAGRILIHQRRWRRKMWAMGGGGDSAPVR